MKVTEKKLGDNRVELTAVATEEEVNKALNEAALVFAQQMNLTPAPKKTIEELAKEQLGIGDLSSIVAPQAAEILVPFAVDKKNLIPAIPPKSVGKSPLKRGEPYTFTLTVTLRPEYELSSYEPVEIFVNSFKFDETLVDRQISAIAEQFIEYVADDPHPVNSGDACVISIEATQGGERMNALSTESRTYVVGMGYMPEAFDEHLIGMNVGETKTFTFAAPRYDDSGEAEEDLIECTVTVKEMQKRVIPAVNDTWVKKNFPMFRDAEALRNSVRERIVRTQRFEYDNYVRQQAAQALARRFKGRIADELYETMQQQMLTSMRAQLGQQGIKLEDYIESMGGKDQFQMMMMMQVRENLIEGFALDALFRHENLTVSDADVLDACRMLNPDQPQVVRDQMKNSGRNFVLREISERMCANKWLVEHANITVQGESDPEPEGSAKKDQ